MLPCPLPIPAHVIQSVFERECMQHEGTASVHSGRLPMCRLLWLVPHMPFIQAAGCCIERSVCDWILAWLACGTCLWAASVVDGWPAWQWRQPRGWPVARPDALAMWCGCHGTGQQAKHQSPIWAGTPAPARYKGILQQCEPHAICAFSQLGTRYHFLGIRLLRRICRRLLPHAGAVPLFITLFICVYCRQLQSSSF